MKFRSSTRTKLPHLAIIPSHSIRPPRHRIHHRSYAIISQTAPHSTTSAPARLTATRKPCPPNPSTPPPSSPSPPGPLPESFPTTTHGSTTWKTLLSAPYTPTDTSTAGLASCPPNGGTLAMHTHEQAELYYGVAGEVEVVVGEERYALRKGDLLYIPGGVRHGVVKTGEGGFRWVYVFAVGGFGEVEYVFEGERAKL